MLHIASTMPKSMQQFEKGRHPKSAEDKRVLRILFLEQCKIRNHPVLRIRMIEVLKIPDAFDPGKQALADIVGIIVSSGLTGLIPRPGDRPAEIAVQKVQDLGSGMKMVSLFEKGINLRPGGVLHQIESNLVDFLESKGAKGPLTVCHALHPMNLLLFFAGFLPFEPGP